MTFNGRSPASSDSLSHVPDIIVRDVLTHLGISLDAIPSGDASFTTLRIPYGYIFTVFEKATRTVYTVHYVSVFDVTTIARVNL